MGSPSREGGGSVRLSPAMEQALKLLNPESFARTSLEDHNNTKGCGLKNILKEEGRKTMLLLGMFYALPSVNPSSSSWSSQGPRDGIRCRALQGEG